MWGDSKKDKMQKMQGFFNWNMTYRRDSTLYTPYGGFVKTRDHPEGEELDDFIKQFGEKNKELARKEKN